MLVETTRLRTNSAARLVRRAAPVGGLGSGPDINNDLWNAPFDNEVEGFAEAVQALLVPILEAVGPFGLKTWHLGSLRRNS